MQGRAAVGIDFAVEVFVGFQSRIGRVAELAGLFVGRVLGGVGRGTAVGV